MSDEQNLPQINSEDLRKFLELQQTELEIRKEEITLRHAEIKSNENIALNSIEANKEADARRGEAFNNIQNKRFFIWIAAIIAITSILMTAMFTKNTAIALEIIKIGGASLLAYFAGLNRGKTKHIESQRED